MPLGVQELSPERDDLSAFVKLPQWVYADDPCFCPSHRSIAASLLRPAFRGRQVALVVRAMGARDRAAPAVARAVARLSPELTDAAGRPLGMLGFYEAVDDPGAGAAVLRHGLRWLRARGAGEVVGPMDGDTWHAYRLNLGPHDEPPFLFEPYNPSYYADHWRAAGFRTLAGYYSLRVDDPAAAARGLTDKAARAGEAGYRFEPLDLRRLPAELDRIYELSRRAFAGNFLYSEISRGDFHRLYGGMRPLLDPRLVWFARDPAGADAAFLFAYPDRFAAVRALGGGIGLAARLRFLLHRERWDAVDIKTLGVLPEHRRAGLAAALMLRVYQEAARRRSPSRPLVANLCLIRDGNPSGALDGGAGRLLRRYELLHAPAEEGS